MGGSKKQEELEHSAAFDSFVTKRAGSQTASPDERRRHTRIPIGLPITVKFPNGLSVGTLHDLSREGIFVDLRGSAPKLPAEVLVEWGFRSGERRCKAQGTLVRNETRGFAARFKAANPDFISFMNDLEALRPELHADFLRDVLEPQVLVKKVG